MYLDMHVLCPWHNIHTEQTYIYICVYVCDLLICVYIQRHICRYMYKAPTRAPGPSPEAPQRAALPFAKVNGALCCRISACIYNAPADYDALLTAIDELRAVDSKTCWNIAEPDAWPSEEFRPQSNKRPRV